MHGDGRERREGLKGRSNRAFDNTHVWPFCSGRAGAEERGQDESKTGWCGIFPAIHAPGQWKAGDIALVSARYIFCRGLYLRGEPPKKQNANMTVVAAVLHACTVDDLAYQEKIPHRRPSSPEEPQGGNGVKGWNDPHRLTRLSSRFSAFCSCFLLLPASAFASASASTATYTSLCLSLYREPPHLPLSLSFRRYFCSLLCSDRMWT